MKITQKSNGKELKGGKVLYNAAGAPEFILHGGLRHLARFFDIEEPKVVKKTKDTPKAKKKSAK